MCEHLGRLRLAFPELGFDGECPSPDHCSGCDHDSRVEHSRVTGHFPLRFATWKICLNCDRRPE